MSEFEITSQKLPYRDPKGLQHVGLIQVQGRLDMATTPELQKVLADYLAQGIYRFIVDLSKVAYMGSAGIGTFIGILDTLEENKGTVVFIHPTPNVKATFNLFRLSTFYSLTDDIESALAELRSLSK